MKQPDLRPTPTTFAVGQKGRLAQAKERESLRAQRTAREARMTLRIAMGAGSKEPKALIREAAGREDAEEAPSAPGGHANTR